MPTSHPRIMSAVEASMDLAEMEGLLAKLVPLAKQKKDSEITEILKQLPIEFLADVSV